MKTKLLTICLLLFSSQVFAGWTKIASTVEGTDFYIDYNRTKVHRGYIYYYSLADMLTPVRNISSIEYYTQVDCKSFRFKYIRFIFYDQPMGKGNSRVDNDSDPWVNLRRDGNSMNHVFLNLICKK